MCVSSFRALVSAFVLALVASVAGAEAAGGGGVREHAPASAGVCAETASAAESVGAGLVARIDPATGQLTSGGGLPPELFADPLLADALSTSGEGLVEVDLGGDRGVMIDLQGRFRNVVVATVGGTGGVTVRHLAAPAAAPTEAREAGHENH